MERVGDILRRIPPYGQPSPSGSPSSESELRACRTCQGEFEAEVRRVGQRLIGPTECPACRDVRQAEEAARAEEERRLALVKLREKWRGSYGLPLKYQGETFALWVQRGWAESKAWKAIRNWAEEFPLSRAFGYPSIFAWSESNGTGKSTLAGCVSNQLFEAHQGDLSAPCPVRYETGPGLLVRVRATYNIKPGEEAWKETEEEVYRKLRGVKLLILDDVGKDTPSPHTSRVYFHIIDQRYGDGLPVMLVSNLNLEGLRQFLGDDQAGRASISRIYAMVEGREHRLPEVDHRLAMGGGR